MLLLKPGRAPHHMALRCCRQDDHDVKVRHVQCSSITLLVTSSAAPATPHASAGPPAGVIRDLVIINEATSRPSEPHLDVYDGAKRAKGVLQGRLIHSIRDIADIQCARGPLRRHRTADRAPVRPRPLLLQLHVLLLHNLESPTTPHCLLLLWVVAPRHPAATAAVPCSRSSAGSAAVVGGRVYGRAAAAIAAGAGGLAAAAAACSCHTYRHCSRGGHSCHSRVRLRRKQDSARQSRTGQHRATSHESCNHVRCQLCDFVQHAGTVTVTSSEQDH